MDWGKAGGAQEGSLIRALENGTTKSEDLPALVVVRFKDVTYVICGNRMFKCYKTVAQDPRRECWFKMIVHDFPSCRKIMHSVQRFACMLKEPQAMSTVSDGQDVAVRTKRGRVR